MEDRKDFFGILLNDRIPKLDKRNEFNKKVKVSFNGTAYLVEENDDGEIEKTPIETDYELKQERDYLIEFTNDKGENYMIEIRIELSYLFILLLLFLLGIVIGLALCRPCAKEDSPFSKIFDYIDLAVIGLNISPNDETDTNTMIDNRLIHRIINKTTVIDNKNEKPQNVYDFDATFKHISSDDINLTNTISAKSLAKNKIAPGVEGSFAINISSKKSTTDMKYNIKFQDITNDKPKHMTFRVRGYNDQYSSLQELEESLIGNIEKQSQKTYIIDWKWDYETGESATSIKENDSIDTSEAQNLNSYKFKIEVFGEEVI